jgi:hypothetical protein
MINKKIISILVLISIFSSTLSYAVTVKDLYPAAKVYNAVSKTWSVPAVIEAVGLNGLAQETVMLSLTKAIMGGVITSLAIAGVGYVANSYIDWLMGNNPSMYYDVDGVLKYDNHATVYSVPAGLLDAASAYAATSLANACPCSCGTGNTVGIVGGSVTSSSHAGYGSVFSHGGWSWNGCIFDWNMWYVDDSSDCPRHRMLYWTAINNACLTAYDSVTKNPVTSPYLNPLNEAAIDSGNSPLNDQSAAAIDKAAQLIAGGIGAAAAAGSLPKKLHDGMVQGISSADAAAVQAAADNKTAAQAAADAVVSGTSSLSQAQLVSALQSQGLSANAIAAAVDAYNKSNNMTAAGLAIAIAGALNGQGLTPAQVQAATSAALASAGISAAGIAAAINSTFPGLTATQLAAALSYCGLTATAIAAAIKAANPSLTQAEVQAAVTAAIAASVTPLTAYSGGNTIGLVPYALPDVGDFAGLFSGFLAAMRKTPLFSLPGLLSSSVPSGGSCYFEVNMSERFGGTHTVSICNWSTGLSCMKAVLLCIASIFAVGIITKGGN